MKTIVNWIINKLGGVTKDEHESKRACYEKWAIENLACKNNEIIPDSFIYIPFDGDKICVLKSNTEISDGFVKSIIIAPWCQNVSIVGVRSERANKELNHEQTR